MPLPDIRGAPPPANTDEAAALAPENGADEESEAGDRVTDLADAPTQEYVRNPMLPEPPARKRKPSMMGENYKKKHQVAIKGHSNVRQVIHRVKKISEVARAENHLELEHIKKFHNIWHAKGGSLGEEDFYDTFKETLGNKWDPKRMHEVCHYLFSMMDTNRDLAVDWSEFCQYIAKGLAEKEIVDHEQENPVMMCAQKFNSKHLGRIVRFESYSSPTRFVSICDDAIACFWNSKMTITQVTHMDSASFISPRASLKVTDACYMPNASTIVICTNARDMRFHHAVTGVMTHKMLLPEIVISLAVHIDEDKPDKAILAYGDFKGKVTAIEFYKATETLFEPLRASKPGKFKPRVDSHGRRQPPSVIQFPQSSLPRFDQGKLREKTAIVTMHSSASKSTFRHSVYTMDKKVEKKTSKAIGEEKDPYCRCDIATLHYPEGDGLNEGSVAIKIVPKMTSVVSIAATSKASMVVYDYHLGSRKTFNVNHGVQGFAIDEHRHLIATGGRDLMLRFWNPHVPGVPLAELAGHVSPITHIVSNASRGQMISVDKNEIIKIWHVTDQTCLNTFVSVIPHSLRYVSNDSAVSSVHALNWHEPSQTLVACSFVEVSCVEIQRGISKAADTAMESSILSMVYVLHFNLLMAGDSRGSIASFDLTTGEQVLEYISGHMNAAVTSLALTANGRRCISGASDGEIYIWNILSGTILQKLRRNGKRKEITGLFSCMMDKVFATGWGGMMSCHHMGEDVDLKRCPIMVEMLPVWGPRQDNTSDIHAMAAAGETMICTGADNGNVVVWDLRIAKQARILNIKSYMGKNSFQEDAVEADEDGYIHKIKSTGANSGGGATIRKFPKHMPSHGAIEQALTVQGSAIRSLHWLKRRIKESVKQGKGRAATLVVGYDGGFVCMWNVVHEEIFGAFYATDDVFGTASVNAIGSDVENKFVFTADSMGWVKQWDISNYCLVGEDNTPPPLCAAWQAHHQPITQLMVHSESNFIITASEDCAIRVWTLQHQGGASKKGVGEYIGSFGTSSSWHVPIEGRMSLSAKLVNPDWDEDPEKHREVRTIDAIADTLEKGSQKVSHIHLKEAAAEIKESLDAHRDDDGVTDQGSDLVHVVNAALAIDRIDAKSGSNASEEKSEKAEDEEELDGFPGASDNATSAPPRSRGSKPRRSTLFAVNNMMNEIDAKEKEDERMGLGKGTSAAESDPEDDLRAFRQSRASAAALGKRLGSPKKRRPQTAPPLQLAQEAIEQYRAKPTRLGSAYGKRQLRWAADRVDARQVMTPRPLISDQDPVVLGLTICTPFTALHLQPESRIVSINKVPSFVRRHATATESAMGHGKRGKRGLVALPKSGHTASPALASMSALNLPSLV